MAGHSRLVSLDALRGVAALTVLLSHAVDDLVPSGYLAVDFFFLLSGFVIARTYEARLGSGMSSATFCKIRLIRLYPLALLGLLLGAVRQLRMTIMAGPDALDPIDLLTSVTAGLAMLPSPAIDRAFPVNAPAWSLFFELAVNLLYALIITRVRVSTRAIGVTVSVSAALLVAVAFSDGSLNVGYTWSTLLGGAARTLFSFSLGTLFARVPSASRASHASYIESKSWVALAPMALLLATLFLPVPASGRALFDIVAVIVVMPAVLSWAARVEPPPRVERIAVWLGALSYPIYAIHFPLVNVMRSAAEAKQVPVIVWLPAATAIIAVTAALSLRYWEAPMRERLKAWLAKCVRRPLVSSTSLDDATAEAQTSGLRNR